MQRLALAVIFATVAVAAIGLAAAVARATWRNVDGAMRDEGRGGELMQKLAFFLLIALILYVSTLGGA